MISRFFVFILILLSIPAVAQKQPERNVILIVTDDQSQDAGFYGNDVIKTPHLDELAAHSAIFTNAYATTASCSASRSVILSGLHNHKTGQYGHTHRHHHFRSFDYLQTLPVLMAESGYRTATIGKFHLAPKEVYNFQEFLPGSPRNAVEMANNSKEFIEADGEFFLYFCTSDPHRGGGEAEELPHKPDRFGNKPAGYAGVETITYEPDSVIVPPYLPDNDVTRAEIAQYYQSISRVDQGVGRLLQILKESGKINNTMIIYIADHGMAFPGAKTTQYEPGLKAPCIVYHPFEKHEMEFRAEFVSWTDLTPSILDFAEARKPEYKMHGQSFIPLLERMASYREREAVYGSHTFHEIQMYYPMRMLNDGKFKIIWNVAWQLPFPFASDLWSAPTWQYVYEQGEKAMYGKKKVKDYLKRPEFELYDLKKDPYESNNLALDPKFVFILDKYKLKIKEFQKQTEDPWLLKWEYE